MTMSLRHHLMLAAAISGSSPAVECVVVVVVVTAEIMVGLAVQAARAAEIPALPRHV
jgi:hypothetical protein